MLNHVSSILWPSQVLPAQYGDSYTLEACGQLAEYANRMYLAGIPPSIT